MKIRILASSDVHGYILDHKYSDNKSLPFGFARMKESMNEYIKENTILIDNGDLLQGSPLMNYYYQHYEGYTNPMAICLNDGYHYYNLGNHDFNYGLKNLELFAKQTESCCICGNVKNDGKALGKEYIIHKFDTKNAIAIIGVTSEYFVRLEKPEYTKKIEVVAAYDYLKKEIDKIKKEENVKAIIGVYHGGFERDLKGNIIQEMTDENQAYRICRDLDLDILITGHQHISLAGKCFNTYVSQTLPNGQQFALIDYDLDNKEGNVEIINSDKPARKEFIEKFSKIEKETQNWLDEILATVKDVSLKVEDEFAARLYKHPVISFINEIQRKKTKAQLSATALFNGATGFNSEITYRDLVSTYIFPNTITVLKINGKTLKEYLEKNAEYFSLNEQDEIIVSKNYLSPTPQHYNYDMVEPLDYTLKISNQIGERVIDMTYQGQKVKDEDEFTIAMNNYRAGCGGNFFMLRDCQKVMEYQQDMVEVMAEYLQNHKEVKVKCENNIHIIK